MNEDTFEFKIDKECKHSRRYASVDDACPIATVYVDRSFADTCDTLSLKITKGA